jgi:hypothetical protein
VHSVSVLWDREGWGKEGLLYSVVNLQVTGFRASVAATLKRQDMQEPRETSEHWVWMGVEVHRIRDFEMISMCDQLPVGLKICHEENME